LATSWKWAGREEKQKDGFEDVGVVLAISVAAIFLELAFQFKNAVKPFLVFAAVPFGAVGALAALWIMGAPFGFMGLLGVIRQVGVIVSHIIVLFDFIEEEHAEGEPFEQAVLDAGIMRLRPVMTTVGATVFGLFSPGRPRRTLVGAAVLRADWRAYDGHVHHAATGARVLQDLRARSEDREMGYGRCQASGRQAGCGRAYRDARVARTG
jgi:hypothetical protein